MARIEILAPVGSEEMLRAAVFSGADAVYLGFSGFNARTGAGNFDADSLQEAVRFCHARGVAVHVALNTTVYGTELPALEQAIRAVAASGADAVICQDLAVATLIGKIAPQLPRHGSTQMSVHTLQGALELKELGFTRVVLARELSLPEVEHITKHCGIETECFIHGALCMSVSGQCYMSAFLGGRSGNRGSCAGPCRLPFEANALPEGKPGRLHHLSLKDNSAIDKLDKLQAIGVASAKIEGRLRTPEYVAAAVSACLAGREGRAYDRDLLKHAFSRSGFTSGYLDGKIDGTMFGVRSEADAELTKKTLPANMRRAAAKGFINATDCADYLTKKGMPFRDAYKLTGCMVSDCIAADKTLEELTLTQFQSYSPLFGADIYDAIDLVHCCEGRTSYGGPSAASVEKQIALATARLDAWEEENA